MSCLLSTADIKVTQKSFNFARKFSLPLYFVSAADGTNVVKVMAYCRGSPARWGRLGGGVAREAMKRRAGCRNSGEDGNCPGACEWACVTGRGHDEYPHDSKGWAWAWAW